MAITWRAVDGDASIHQALAGFVDVVDAVSEVSKIAAASVGFGWAAVFRGPIVSELDFSEAFLTGGGEEDEREAALFAAEPADFVKADQGEELHCCFRVGDADHGVEIMGHVDCQLERVNGP